MGVATLFEVSTCTYVVAVLFSEPLQRKPLLVPPYPMRHHNLCGAQWLVLTDPAAVAEVLHHKDFDKPRHIYKDVSKMMGPLELPDLVTAATDDDWKLFRKGVAPAFNPHNIRTCVAWFLPGWHFAGDWRRSPVQPRVTFRA
jgi:cytochrome P450